MGKESAGILACRKQAGAWEFLLAHPGGPFWQKKDLGAWTIPKGEINPSEDPLSAAIREFAEETGTCPAGEFIPLKPVRQKGGKTIHSWAWVGNLDVTGLKSNLFDLEWPPRSGRFRSFPEIDRAGWFAPDDARRKLNPAQAELIDDALAKLPTS